MPHPPTAFVVAHHDPAERVALYVRNLLGYLRAVTPDVVLVSSSLCDSEAAALGQSVRVLRREHAADRLASYQLGLGALGDLARFERVVALDASLFVMHPHVLCEKALASVPDADVVGLTACRRPEAHIQSHWVSFHGARVLRSEAFARWWRGGAPSAGDVAMSRFFAEQGFRLGVAYRPDRNAKVLGLCRAVDCGALQFEIGPQGPVQLDPDLADSLDPTVFCWDGLLSEFGVFRLDLLRSTPFGANVGLLRHWLKSDEPESALAREALAADAPAAARTAEVSR